MKIDTGIKINPLVFNNLLYITTEKDIRAISLDNGKDVWVLKKEAGKVSCLPLQLIEGGLYWPQLSTKHNYSN